jgi:hypothetical protein
MAAFQPPPGEGEPLLLFLAPPTSSRETSYTLHVGSLATYCSTNPSDGVSRTVVVTSGEGHVGLWDAESGECFKVLDVVSGRFTQMIVYELPDGQSSRIVGLGHEGRIIMLDGDSGDLVLDAQHADGASQVRLHSGCLRHEVSGGESEHIGCKRCFPCVHHVRTAVEVMMMTFVQILHPHVYEGTKEVVVLVGSNENNVEVRDGRTGVLLRTIGRGDLVNNAVW